MLYFPKAVIKYFKITFIFSKIVKYVYILNMYTYKFYMFCSYKQWRIYGGGVQGVQTPQTSWFHGSGSNAERRFPSAFRYREKKKKTPHGDTQRRKKCCF